MMTKFKIERGVLPPKRGPKPRLDYDAIPLERMVSGESVKIAEVPKSRRNSTYLTVIGVLQKRFDALGGNFKVSTALINEDICEVRVWKN
jgi:hypothetical protein